MKVLITGDREWFSDRHVDVIYAELSALPAGTVIVHGAARGVDTIADVIARALDFTVRPYPANWSLYGKKAAGPIRNRKMLNDEHNNSKEPIDVVLAFHDSLDESKGTKDMVSISNKAGIVVKLITSL